MEFCFDKLVSMNNKGRFDLMDNFMLGWIHVQEGSKDESTTHTHTHCGASDELAPVPGSPPAWNSRRAALQRCSSLEVGSLCCSHRSTEVSFSQTVD